MFIISLCLPQKLYRNTYLCSDNYDEAYFDFHCLRDPPLDGSEWYTICGTPFQNRVEYVAILVLYCVLAATVFRQLLFHSSRTLVYGAGKKENVKAKKS